jgi:hypothetical protein
MWGKERCLNKEEKKMKKEREYSGKKVGAFVP